MHKIATYDPSCNCVSIKCQCEKSLFTYIVHFTVLVLFQQTHFDKLNLQNFKKLEVRNLTNEMIAYINRILARSLRHTQ